MTIPDPTSDQPESTPRTVRAAAASVALFLAAHPEFEGTPLNWRITTDGEVDLGVEHRHPESARLVLGIAAGLHARVDRHFFTTNGDGIRLESLSIWDAEYAGAVWHVHGYQPVTPYDEFIAQHDADPQNWTVREREAFAQLSGGALVVAS